MALGASGSTVRRQVLRETLALAGAGVGLGLIVATLVSTAMSALLYEIRPSDPVTFARNRGRLAGRRRVGWLSSGTKGVADRSDDRFTSRLARQSSVLRDLLGDSGFLHQLLDRIDFDRDKVGHVLVARICDHDRVFEPYVHAIFWNCHRGFDGKDHTGFEHVIRRIHVVNFHPDHMPETAAS